MSIAISLLLLPHSCCLLSVLLRMPCFLPLDYLLWNYSPHCKCPSTASSASTVAATFTDPPQPPRRPPRTSKRSLLPPHPKSTYNLRGKSTHNPLTTPDKPIIIDIPSPLPQSPASSSASTCPATAASSITTPRLRLICKRSRTESSLETEPMGEGEWYVQGDPPPPLHSSASASSFRAFYEEEQQFNRTPPSFQPQKPRRSLRRRHGGTSASNTSPSNTPSPPHLQASGSPPPPILHQPDYDRFLQACIVETAPPLDNDDDGVRSSSSEGSLKPLTMKIKRLGQQLYCIPSSEHGAEEDDCI